MRRRLRRTPAAVVAAALLLLWGVVTLGWYFAIALAMLAAAAATVLLTRRRPDIAVSVGIAAATMVAPAAAAALELQTGKPENAALPLLVFSFAGAVPTLLAWLPPPLISRTVNALLGSLILLTGASIQWLTGDRGDRILYLTLLTSSAVVVARQHRARRRLTSHLTTSNGWTELGRRFPSAGNDVDQLLIGHGRAIPIWIHHRPDPPPGTLLDQHLAAAAALAHQLLIPASRVQPVVLHGTSDGRCISRLCNTGKVAGYVLVAAPDALPTISAQFAATQPTPPRCVAWPARALNRQLDLNIVRRAAALPTTGG